MESELRTLIFTAIKNFADTEGLKVVWESTEDSNETVDDNGNYVNADVDNETIFLRPRITAITPDTKGTKRGLAIHKWNIQISIYVKANSGSMEAAEIADKLRDAFTPGSVTSGVNHKYTQINCIDLKPPIPMGAWKANPVLFRVQTVR